MQIWLLRHARAEDAAISGRDEDRRLCPGGRAACHKLQDWIRDFRGVLPGTLLVSPAMRTLQTAETALDRVGLPPVEVEAALWNATVGELLDLIQRFGDNPQPLCLVGHNPGLEDLVIWLCGGIPVPGMKPGTLAIIHIDPPLRPGCGRLEHFFQPSEST